MITLWIIDGVYYVGQTSPNRNTVIIVQTPAGLLFLREVGWRDLPAILLRDTRLVLDRIGYRIADLLEKLGRLVR